MPENKITVIDAENLEFSELNAIIREAGDCEIKNCLGQRFIAAGMSYRSIKIGGTPGNALGAYLNGGTVEVFGNAQDAVGDTMNDGKIIIHGSIGDAAGYAMRGGEIFVKTDAGYRAGIHMKAYKDKVPVMVIGGRTGSFLGEYQAGGLIIVLGLNTDGKPIVGNFPCTGMHGGKLFLRSKCEGIVFPKQVTARPASPDDIKEIEKYVGEYCALYGEDFESLISSDYTVVTPDSKNPYKQMYVQN